LNEQGNDMNKSNSAEYVNSSYQDAEMSIADIIREEYLNKPLAILCARYWYRGIVSRVGKDFVVLSHVRAVEVTGPAAGNTPNTEDPVPSDMIISTGAIEQACQPLWCWHGLGHVIKPPKEISEQIQKNSGKPS